MSNIKSKYVNMASLDAECNDVVNNAIKLSVESHCDAVTPAHLFMAVMTYNEGKQSTALLSSLNANIAMLSDGYNNLVANGYLGKREEHDKPFTVDDIPEETMEILTKAIAIALSHQRVKVTYSDILSVCTDIMYTDNTIVELLKESGVSEDVLKDKSSMYVAFEIPSSLSSMVEDLSTNTNILNEAIYGVDNYVNSMVEVLSRKIKSNPCLIGEAGVGKTTIVHRLVQRVANGEVPQQFKRTHICIVDSAAVTSGTKYRGEFEERMTELINWAKSNDVLLFFDEIHMFINSGKTSEDSAMSGGEIIKTHISDGSIKIIGATTIDKYDRLIENNKEFSRRLQTIEVKEPSADDAIIMVKQTICEYEQFHGVTVSDDVIELAVKLTNRYMKDKFLPDKAYTILDQACAKTKILGEKAVTKDTLLAEVSKITGIDINKLSDDDKKGLLVLEDKLGKSVIGQTTAIEKVCKAIRRSKAGTRDTNKPVASFLFVGPTGVGKTELCRVLSEEVTPGRESFIKIDMSECSESTGVAKLIGSAPGYVGYNEGGQLTKKVKHNPYSLILFDEIEKAHPTVYNVLLQLLDEGRMTDGRGTTVDFTNCIVIMTSNAGYGAASLKKKALGFGAPADVSDTDTDKKVMEALGETFKPEFLNRFDDIVLFNKLDSEACRKIAKLMLDKLATRVKENSGVTLSFSDSVITMICKSGFDDKYGARQLKRKIQDTVEDRLSTCLLDGTIKDGFSYTIGYNDTNNRITIDTVNE